MSQPKFLIPTQVLRRHFQKGFIAPLIQKIPVNQSSWEIFKKIQSSENSFILDSARFHKKTGVFSYLASGPFLILRKRGRNILVERPLTPTPLPQAGEGISKSISLSHRERVRVRVVKKPGDFLKEMRKLFQQYRGRKWNAGPEFLGGAVGYFSYDLAWDFERLPNWAKKDQKLDDAVFLFIRNLIAYDESRKEIYFVSNLMPSEEGSFEEQLRNAEQWIERTQSVIARSECDEAIYGSEIVSALYKKVPRNDRVAIRNFKSDIQNQKFESIVKKAKNYIKAGDIYQANLSQRFSFNISGSPETLYERLREINPSPFSSFFKIGNLSIISSSPERLIKKRGNDCETRPIAGTRPRGKSAAQNQKLRSELLTNPKERAEHIMLVDLERNDLGRVCKPHTVRVSEMMVLEEYSHVVHIVSNVKGELRHDCDQFDLVKAMFPGGTITGCPKIRCMEIIEELEPFKRGIYTGSIGYFGFNGDLDLNIVIRTIVINQGKGYFQVGAGIVHDSRPNSEYQETLQKGKALVEALSV